MGEFTDEQLARWSEDIDGGDERAVFAAAKEGYKNDDLPSDSPRAKVLQEAESLITGDRNASYGTPTQNFQNTADLLNVQFGHKLKERLTATDVAMIMIQLKMARLIASPNKRDNWVDLAGYAACGFETTEGTE